MYTLRCTKPLLTRLGEHARPSAGARTDNTTTLGDWYANALNLGRLRLVLCTNERSLLSVVVPAKNLPGLPQRLTQSLALLLERMGVPRTVVRREISEMACVRLDCTLNRSVLGSMNDFADAAGTLLHDSAMHLELRDLDWELNETPCAPLQYAFPRERAMELLLSHQAWRFRPL